MSPDSETGRKPTGKIAFATVVRPDELPFESDIDALRSALVPGTGVERHNRIWRLGQIEERKDFIYGRIGFESSGRETEVWNAARKDFEEMTFPSGTTSPFAVRKSDLRTAFQLRGNTIRRQTFAGAFQALLREASGSRWRVVFDSAAVDFRNWVATVDRVTVLRFRLEEPNPHYGGRDLIRNLVEDTGARLSDVVLNVDEDQLDGINVDSDFVAQAVEHVEHNYGAVKAVGERTVDGETETLRWDGGQEIEDRLVSADPQTGEVQPTAFGRELTGGDNGAEGDDDEREPDGGDSAEED